MSILEYIIVSFFWILFFFFTNIPNEQKKVGFSQQGNKQEVNYSTCKTKTNKKSWVVLQVENNSPPSCRCCCDSITGCVLNSTTAFKNTNRKGHRTIHNQHQCWFSIMEQRWRCLTLVWCLGSVGPFFNVCWIREIWHHYFFNLTPIGFGRFSGKNI